MKSQTQYTNFTFSYKWKVFYMSRRIYSIYRKTIITGRPNAFESLSEECMWQYVAFIKQLMISVCSVNPYQVKVMQSNLNITDSSYSNCINFKATRPKAIVKQNWIFTDPYLRRWYKCLKPLLLEQILRPFLNEFRSQKNSPKLTLLKVYLTKKRERKRRKGK